MLINGSATKRGFFIMPIVKSSVWMRELLVKANLVIKKRHIFMLINGSVSLRDFFIMPMNE